MVNDPELIIGKTIQDLGSDVWNLNLQTTTLGPSVAFAGFTTGDNGPNLWFHKAPGGTTLESVDEDNQLGVIAFKGYTAEWKTLAEIRSTVRAVNLDDATADLQFRTTGTDGNIVRMTITDAGSVVITDLAGNGTVNLQVDNSGKLIRGSSAPSNPFNQEIIKELQTENEELRSRLTKLEAIIEELSMK